MVAIVFALISCSGKDEIKKNIIEMTSRPVVINDGGMQIWIPKDSACFVEERDYKLVIYVDSSRCTKCFINQLPDWKELLSLEKEEGSHMQFIFILEPHRGDSDSTKNSLEKSGFEHYVFIDQNSIFREANTHIPHGSEYHTFLLDKNNNIILVGNPLRNDRINKLFLKRIGKTD